MRAKSSNSLSLSFSLSLSLSLSLSADQRVGVPHPEGGYEREHVRKSFGKQNCGGNRQVSSTSKPEQEEKRILD